MMAYQAKKAAVAELLVARGARPDIRDNKGRTAIEHSRQAGLTAWLQAEQEKAARERASSPVGAACPGFSRPYAPGSTDKCVPSFQNCP